MKKIFILLSITVTLIPTCATYAQSDPYERHIDSLFRSGLHEEAYQFNLVYNHTVVTEKLYTNVSVQ